MITDVALPAHWRVVESDGHLTYPDEPDVAIPAGLYLVGADQPDDPESSRVVLRVELATDPGPLMGPNPPPTRGDVVDALAQHLTTSIARADT